MKNYEKYADVIKKLKSNIGIEWCEVFAKPKVLKSFGRTCEEASCGLCNTLTTLWLLEDYEEPEIDWSNVEVDTPILVRDSENEEWLKKYFAKYEDGFVYVWNLGRTSWTAPNKSVSAWKYAKLVEDEKEAEVDWSKVEVDTPILVRDFEGSDWFRRHFAKYENGTVYAWDGGDTSWSGVGVMTDWKYAKLAASVEGYL